jgi:O-antigen ligase
LIFFLARSGEHPWTEPRFLWLWGLFLLLTIYPAIKGGSLMLYDAASFYPSNILGAILLFWLGSILGKDSSRVRLLFQILAGLGAILAIHTLIQALTGVVVFSSTHADAYLEGVSNYQLSGSDAHRAGSFFIDPNWNGTFLATIFFLSLGLFVHSSSLSGKIIALLEMGLMLLALLFTYSNGAWIGAGLGLLGFLVFIGRARYRILLPLLILVACTVIILIFPGQVALQLQHATGPDELSLRLGAWQTALGVISAYPLIGVGLGYQIYLVRADPYRVPAQFVPLSHPHNSYLEWGAMAGLPVLCIFLVLLGSAFCWGVRNWLLADRYIRPLLGGGLAAIITLSGNSISINGWTHPALGMIGWLILGTISSPLLEKSFHRRNES